MITIVWFPSSVVAMLTIRFHVMLSLVFFSYCGKDIMILFIYCV